MSETVTVQEQLRQYRERVQRTLPLIANPIGWTGLVDTLELAANEIDRLARELRETNRLLTGAGIAELATRNPNLASYMREWEARAVAAEAEVARLREALTVPVSEAYEYEGYLEANIHVSIDTLYLLQQFVGAAQEVRDVQGSPIEVTDLRLIEED